MHDNDLEWVKRAMPSVPSSSVTALDISVWIQPATNLLCAKVWKTLRLPHWGKQPSYPASPTNSNWYPCKIGELYYVAHFPSVRCMNLSTGIMDGAVYGNVKGTDLHVILSCCLALWPYLMSSAITLPVQKQVCLVKLKEPHGHIYTCRHMQLK